MKRNTIGSVAVILWLSWWPVQAMQVSFTVEPDILSVGEGGQIVLRIENGPRQVAPPEIPAIDGLRIGTPATEQGSSIQIINGRRTQSYSLTFRYPVVPLRPGSYTIGPFVYDINGTQVELPARSLRVAGPQNVASDARKELTDLVFARVLVERNAVYAQEPFPITIAIYSRGVNLGRDVSLMDMPDKGIALTPFQEMRSTREIVDQEIYEVRRFQAYARGVYSGSLQFAPTLRVHLLVERSRDRRHDLFSTFFSGMEAHPLELKVEPVDVTVQALPSDGRPDMFSGGVGDFNFDVNAQPTEVRAGDPITLQIMVAGEGNIEDVGAPSMEESEDWRVYPARLIDEEINNTQTSGRKLFEQIIIPRHDQITEIPALEFSYFHPEDEQYRRIKQGPIHLRVRAGEGPASRVVRGDSEESGSSQTRILGSDIRYLKTNGIRAMRSRPWYRHPAFFGMQLFPPIMALAVFWIERRKQKLRSNTAYARRMHAPKSAREGLKRAWKALDDKNTTAYHDAIWQALTSYFGHRLNLPPGDVGIHTIQTSLKQAGIDAEDVVWLEELFARCEHARYAQMQGVSVDPATGEEELKRIERLLKKCERVSL
jgi:hypothetical protein